MEISSSRVEENWRPSLLELLGLYNRSDGRGRVSHSQSGTS